MRKKNYSFWLIVTYVAMAAVCAALIVFGNRDITSIAVNVGMFVIVAILFVFAIHRFSVGYRMQKALQSATKRIREDAKNDSRYLWDKYKADGTGGLFPDNILTKQYQKYAAEMLRLEAIPNAEYKCDIQDYINQEYVDASMKKNILNLISGTMTGLGILGTFIGLSFGLQYFNTGTAAEITDSIAPLMEGIKVAFHTSVYGMVFSLVYNFVYKANMEAVYSQLEEFLSVFNTYVAGDPYNDNESSLREMIQAMPAQLGSAISEQMGESLSPIVYNMNKTMMEFAQKISDNQAAGLRGLVNEFVEKMDIAMEGSYRRLGQVINETVAIQQENNAFAQTIMERLANVTANVNEINALSARVINGMSSYIGEVEKLQAVVTENYSSTYRQLETLQEHEERMQEYVYAISAHEKEVNDSIKQELDEVIKISRLFSGEIQNTSQKLTTVLDSARTEIDAAARELSSASVGLDEKLTRSVTETFNLFDSNMAKITGQLNETVSGIERTTDRVPEVVLAAYTNMKQSFDAMQSEMNSLLQAMEKSGQKNA